MPNHFFNFKKFTVHQERSAMKVCTEACLFGAWVAQVVRGEGSGTVRTLLDIGAGTGLLSLMLAQKLDSEIDAIEIDPAASSEASRNFLASPWPERLKIFNASVQQFLGRGQPYDLVVSNPPFHQNDLQATGQARNMALHEGSLTLQELFLSAERLSGIGSLFALLLPYRRNDFFMSVLDQFPFRILKKTNVRQTGHHPYFRTMYLLRRTAEPIAYQENELIIKEGEQYSAAFSDLLKDYYLSMTNSAT